MGAGIRRAFYNSPVTPAVILAAGRSSRFGRAKALLTIAPSGQTFVARLVTTFHAAGIDDVLVVGRAGDTPLSDAVNGASGRFVVNPDPDRGQLSSLVAALEAIDPDGVRGVIVTPVDMPLVAVSTIVAVRDAFLEASAPVARATYRGRHGHPVIFGVQVFDELRRADPGVGARAVLRTHHADVLNVEVPDPAILGDVDTPADYRDLFGRDP